jgi:Fic family protein
MQSFLDLAQTVAAQPPHVGVLLGHIDVGKGREELYRDQLPELLVGLAAETRIASIRASTALEGYDVPNDRAQNLAASPPARVRNRNEKEFAGYRDAIDGLVRSQLSEPASLPLVLHLHRQLYAYSGGRGGRLKSENNEIVRYDDDGRRELIFTPVSWKQTEFALSELLARFNAACDRQDAHPLVLLGLFTLDLLAIHPVADGNGRLTRLLTTHQLLRMGYGVARYVSVEQRIFETRQSYYEALRSSQMGWHEAAHDVWPWISYFAGVLAGAYQTLEARVAAARSTTGMSKHDIVRRHVELMAVGSVFRFRDLRAALPGISDQTLRLALISLRDNGLAVASGHGAGARWTRTGTTAAGR